MKKAATQSARIDRNGTPEQGAAIFANMSKEEAAILKSSEVVYIGVCAVVYKDTAMIIKATGGLPEMSGLDEKREAAVKEFTKALRKAMVEAQDELIAEEARKYVKAGMTQEQVEEEVGYEPSPV